MFWFPRRLRTESNLHQRGMDPTTPSPVQRALFLRASHLDQLLAGCCNLELLLPFVELSHDEINVLISQSLPAKFGCRKLWSQKKKKGGGCVILNVLIRPVNGDIFYTRKSVSSSIFLMSGSSSLFLSSGRYCRSTGRPDHISNGVSSVLPAWVMMLPERPVPVLWLFNDG